MAITNFIPELWSANILLELQKNLVFVSSAFRRSVPVNFRFSHQK